MKATGHSLIDQEIAKQLGEDEVVLKAMGMTREDAEEYFQFNIAGAFVGDQTPVFLQDE